jgi:hypothetical protein
MMKLPFFMINTSLFSIIIGTSTYVSASYSNSGASSTSSSFTFLTPTQDSTLVAGTNFNITWTADTSDSSVANANIQLSLMRTRSSNDVSLQSLQVIGIHFLLIFHVDTHA